MSEDKYELSLDDWNIANPIEEAALLLEKLFQEKDMIQYLEPAKKLFPYRNLIQKLENKKKNKTDETIDYISEIKRIVEYCEKQKGNGVLGVGL